MIYDVSIVKKLVDSKYDSAAVIAKYEEWMDGTVVTLNDEGFINSFYRKKKTLNIKKC
ncbi:MAG: hypothetical protein L6V91_03240 [Bacilli bacterium]|nr:MAG: hypothetical protein L6V91_03240 [Bacilli bacterium]